MVTVGLLYPGHSAEDDFPALEARIDGAVRLPVVITSVDEDAHEVDALLDLGSDERLAEGAARLADEKPDAVMWACTSGSFVFGPRRRQGPGVRGRDRGGCSGVVDLDRVRRRASTPRHPPSRGRRVLPRRRGPAFRRAS